TFESLDDGKGDLNFDGLINNLDIKLLQEYLVGKTTLDNKAAERADLCKDGIINVFDCVMLKRKIMENMEYGLGVPPEDELDEEEFNKFFEKAVAANDILNY
ncbi:MAG: dockerin type I repeat-containing protein, partial [Clostridium sp.]|nr:dockerin type I repeat-containing protein [Clostridium sp.]